MAKIAVMIPGASSGGGCWDYLVTVKTLEILGQGADIGRVHFAI